MTTLLDLTNSIGEWSRTNFPMNHQYTPILGVFEEYASEFIDAHLNKGYDDIRDAICDTVIFLLDFCARSNIDPTECILEGSSNDTQRSLQSLFPEQRILVTVKAIGYLSRIVLKRHQQIKLDICTIDELKAAIGEVLLCLMYEGRARGFDTIVATAHTWERIVAKRDWNAHREGDIS